VKKKFLILVPVRLKSNRLKRKALINLHKKPLIIRLTERIKLAKIPIDIVWCTSKNKDDDKLEVLAKLNKISLFRGDELNVLSRFLSVIKLRKADGIVRITGDNPLTDPQLIDEMIKDHIKSKSEYTYVDNIPFGTSPEIISKKALIKCDKIIKNKNLTEYLSFYLKRSDYFKIKKYKINNKKLIRKDIRLTVDTKEDLEVIKKIYNNFKGNPPSLEIIINWLDKNPIIKNINNKVERLDLAIKKNCKLIGDI
jgi:spore coat polysaccharide biosynthesis protein SpsF